MLKLFSMVVYFLKELIFDSKEEYDFKSANFNPRKFSVFLLVTLSFVLNLFLIQRIWNLASAVVDVKIELEQSTINCGKNIKTVPSDSRKQEQVIN